MEGCWSTQSRSTRFAYVNNRVGVLAQRRERTSSSSILMKSVVVFGRPLRCEIQDVPIPNPGSDEVLIRVLFCASNPRGWKAPDHLLPAHEPINQGTEMGGYYRERRPRCFYIQARRPCRSGSSATNALGHLRRVLSRASEYMLWDPAKHFLRRSVHDPVRPLYSSSGGPSTLGRFLRCAAAPNGRLA